jgi:hypothetical protein
VAGMIDITLEMERAAAQHAGTGALVARAH